MKLDLATFWRVQRIIFGVCPRSGQFFRLSDCKVFPRSLPSPDWMDEVKASKERVDDLEEQLEQEEESLREPGRVRGRLMAVEIVRALDPVFTPRNLNPDDAKVLFHPVDYIVFNGMKRGITESILLLDRARASSADAALQESISDVIRRGRYEWQTLRVDNQGNVSEED